MPSLQRIPLTSFFLGEIMSGDPYPIDSNVNRSNAISALDFLTAWRQGRIELVECDVIQHKKGMKAELKLVFR
jgi:hypothetical protein